MEEEGQIRTGSFNWVAVLSLIAILAILVCGIVPAVNSARESGRRTSCQCHGRNVSTALINYENSQNAFPGYSNVLTTTDKKVYVDPKAGKKVGVSWTILIMRQLDRPDLLDAWKTPVPKLTPALAKAKQTPIDLFVCPSDPPTDPTGTSLSYVVNCGMKDWAGSASMPRDWSENGVFFDRFAGDERVVDDKDSQIPIVTSSSAYIARHDGLQNTILITENVDAGNYTNTDETRVGVLWNPRGIIVKTKQPPHLAPADENMHINRGIGMSELLARNVGRAVFARPSSHHPGGVNVVFCDSHLKFVSDQIDYYVYCLLMSPDGLHVREPGSEKIVPGFSRPVEDSWIY